MTNLEQAQQYAHDHNIGINRVPMYTNQRAFAMRLGNYKEIFIDNNDEYTDAELESYIWHEVAHHETNSLYDAYTPEKIRMYHERRSAVWVINKRLPKHILKKAIEQGKQCWEMAEDFNVPERMVRFAVDYYFGISGVWDGKLAVAGQTTFH